MEYDRDFPYLDNSFVIARKEAECEKAILGLVKSFTELEFTVNTTKSVLKHTQNLTFSGFEINSISMHVTLTEEKQIGMSKTPDMPCITLNIY